MGFFVVVEINIAFADPDVKSVSHLPGTYSPITFTSPSPCISFLKAFTKNCSLDQIFRHWKMRENIVGQRVFEQHNIRSAGKFHSVARNHYLKLLI